MKFRTEIDIYPSENKLTQQDRLIALGSCFSQAVGSRLDEGGISTAVNPMGVLFNPVSIASVVKRSLEGREYTRDDLYKDNNGIYHLLAFESRRQNKDAAALLETVNHDFTKFSQTLAEADCLLVTFGTAWCFSHIPTDKVVGNCHKLPDSEFERFLCPTNEIVDLWEDIVSQVPRIIFTVSPVRHLNAGLHGNTLSKARLHLAVENLCESSPKVEYFPAYEALIDDLRDYRFYADDMKHPSNQAEEYIFEKFTGCYFTPAVQDKIRENRKAALRLKHRSILA